MLYTFRRTKNREQRAENKEQRDRPGFVLCLFVLCLFVLCSFRVLSVTVYWACTLAHHPPPSDSKGAGRAQLLAVWPRFAHTSCKAFRRCLRGNFRFQISDFRLGNLQSTICNLQYRSGHYFKGGPLEGVTSGSSWELTPSLGQGIVTGVTTVPGLGNYPRALELRIQN
jgi:hypothetical protein